MNQLQKIGAQLVDSPKIPWWMRYPYRPVLSAASVGKKGIEAGISGKRRAQRKMQEIAAALERRR